MVSDYCKKRKSFQTARLLIVSILQISTDYCFLKIVTSQICWHLLTTPHSNVKGLGSMKFIYKHRQNSSSCQLITSVFSITACYQNLLIFSKYSSSRFTQGDSKNMLWLMSICVHDWNSKIKWICLKKFIKIINNKWQYQ